MPAYPEDHTLATHVKRPPASVDPPAEVSTIHAHLRTIQQNGQYASLVQAKFCLQLKPGLSPDFVHRVHGSRSDASAPDKVWLTPARSRLNRPQICKSVTSSSEWSQTGGQGVDSPAPRF